MGGGTGFYLIGGVTVNGIVKWDGASWSALGGGMCGYVNALALYNGALYAGGIFTEAGGVSANNIAKWDGSSWSPLGSGMNGAVYALAVHDGALCAGGHFTTAGGVSANYIAKWDGSSWSPLGSGISGDRHLPLAVHGLAVYDGALCAGGRFTTAGGVSASNIARWDGSSWSPLASGINGSVSSLAVYNGALCAGGEFTTDGEVGAKWIAKWDGSSWSPLSGGMSGPYGVRIYALAVYDGALYAGGFFETAGRVSASNIAKWDGSSWSALGSGMNRDVYALATCDDALYAGGTFTTAGDYPSGCMARWGCIAASDASLAEMKRRPDDAWAGCPSLSSIAGFPNCSYAESPDRSSGLRVTGLSQPLQVGKMYGIAGRMDTDENGERCIRAWQVSQGADGPVDPLTMPVRSLGGSPWQYDPASGGGQRGVKAWTWKTEDGDISVRALADLPGLNNIGLLVSAIGKVVWSGGGYFYMDDGSRCDDFQYPDTANGMPPGVRVTLPEGVVAPADGTTVSVTGISSCLDIGGGTIIRRLLPRTTQDIVVIGE